MKKQLILREDIDKVNACFVIKEVDLTKPHIMRLEPYDPKRADEQHTDKQRKTYWMWMDEAVEQGGGTGDRYGLDEDMRKRFVKATSYTRLNGTTGEYRKTISQLGKKELSDLMSNVWVLLHEFGITLTDPGRQHDT